MIPETTRKPILAVIASLIMPGLGQVYNGQIVKGLIFFVILLVLTPLSPLPAWLALHSGWHLILMVTLLFAAVALGIYIYSIRDAFRTARQIGASYTLKPVNRSYTYVIAFIIGNFIYLVLFHYTNQHLLQAVHVPSASMLPNVMPGDYLFIDKRVNCPACKNMLVRGELAIFYPPTGQHKLYIKRIIGLPGDKIVIKGRDVSVNGVRLRTQVITRFSHEELNRLLHNHFAWQEQDDKTVYAVIWQKDSPRQKAATYTVPADNVFVLGDNRSASRDSRDFGMVPLRNVIGEARQAWFSYSKNSGIRWWRIGYPVDARHSD
ncbi:MAG: signal peptidase I [Gammaproteobacteria bacterium]|jgi:signal peptidase I